MRTALLAGALGTVLSAPAFAQGLPIPYSEVAESFLASGPLGPAIYAAQHFYADIGHGSYTWSGYVPCDIPGDAGCGTEYGNGPYNQLYFATDISLVGCIYYSLQSYMTYLGAQPHGETGGCQPAPPLANGAQSYAFDGYQACSRGLLCFNGWLPLFLTGLDEISCLSMMFQSGYRLPPEISGPQPPRGTCIPPIPGLP